MKSLWWTTVALTAPRSVRARRTGAIVDEGDNVGLESGDADESGAGRAAHSGASGEPSPPCGWRIESLGHAARDIRRRRAHRSDAVAHRDRHRVTASQPSFL